MHKSLNRGIRKIMFRRPQKRKPQSTKMRQRKRVCKNREQRICRKTRSNKASGYFSRVPFSVINHLFQLLENAKDRISLASTCSKMWRCFCEMRDPDYGLKIPVSLHLKGLEGYQTCCSILKSSAVFSRLVKVHFDKVVGHNGNPINLSVLPAFKELKYKGEVYLDGLQEACCKESIEKVVIKQLDNVNEEEVFAWKWTCKTLVFYSPIPSNLYHFRNVRNVCLINEKDAEYCCLDIAPLKKCEFVCVENMQIRGLERIGKVHTLVLKTCQIEGFPEGTQMGTRRLSLQECDFILTNEGEEEYSRPDFEWFPHAEEIIIRKQVGVEGEEALLRMEKLRKLKLDDVQDMPMRQMNVFFSVPFLEILFIRKIKKMTRVPDVNGMIGLLQIVENPCLHDIGSLLITDRVAEVQIGGCDMVSEEQLALLAMKSSMDSKVK